MSNFQINPNFSNFDNSIADFNKTFSSSLKNADENLKAGLRFDEVFNSMDEKQNINSKGNSKLNSKANLKLPIMDSLTNEAPKHKSLSPVAKLADDIAKGFSGGINELNDVQRQSEEDIETFASGGDISIHQVMISAQKSQLSMQMAIQLRNQMLNTYNEFKNLSI